MNLKPVDQIALEAIIASIKNGAEVSCDLWDTVKLPWDILPSDYVKFAQKDLEGSGKRSIVNALSNIKRALECQIDSLLFALDLTTKSKKLNVPSKLKLLNDIGVIAPNVLRKVNKYRNEMEHEYSCPDSDAAMDFVDVVCLFVEATKHHIYDRGCEWYVDISESKGKIIVRTENGLVIAQDYKPCFEPKGVEIKKDSNEYSQLLGALILATLEG